MIKITKRQLRSALGDGITDAQISRFFGISQAAVSQWEEDDHIPERRALSALLTRPDLFGRFAEQAANDAVGPASSAGEG